MPFMPQTELDRIPISRFSTALCLLFTAILALSCGGETRQSSEAPASNLGELPGAGAETAPSAIDEAELAGLDSLLTHGRKCLSTGRVDEALEIFGDATTIAIKYQLELPGAEAFAGLAECYAITGDIESARDYYLNEALPRTLGRDFGQISPLGTAMVHRSLGDLERRIGNLDSAQVHYEESLRLYTNLKSAVGEAIVSHSLGELARARFKYDEARTHYLKADSIFRDIGHELGQGNTQQALGDLDLSTKRPDSALEHYTQALALAQATKNPLAEANALYGLGNVGFVRNDHESATEHFNQARVIYRRIGSKLGQANVLVGLGDIAIKRGDTTAVASNLTEAATLFESMKMDAQARTARAKLDFSRRRSGGNLGTP